MHITRHDLYLLEISTMTLKQKMMLLGLFLMPAISNAQVSANVGMVSDYIYRGIFQEASSAFGGIDY